MKQKKQKTKKCSVKGCEFNESSWINGEGFCQFHFDKFKFRQTRVEY